jgi:hypothetical protein
MNFSHMTEYSVVDSNNTRYRNAAVYLKEKNGLDSTNSIHDTRSNPNNIIVDIIHVLNDDKCLLFCKYEYWISKSMPDIEYHMNILKEVLVLMYSQNPNAFEELTLNYSLQRENCTHKMLAFYDDIIGTVNGSYILK